MDTEFITSAQIRDSQEACRDCSAVARPLRHALSMAVYGEVKTPEEALTEYAERIGACLLEQEHRPLHGLYRLAPTPCGAANIGRPDARYAEIPVALPKKRRAKATAPVTT